MVKIEFQVRDLVSNTLVVDVKNQVGLAMDDTCSGTYTGMFGFLDVMHLADGELDTPPELLCNHPIRMSMTMTDTGGRSVVKELDLSHDPISGRRDLQRQRSKQGQKRSASPA